ncbi:AAA family ATPase [Marinicrinis sediminis]|uniref:AAA family ATPase n=1 Tax=Marinicrinis sediminis TaxID=1652465 RepID=A0ABW5REK3_9BACL
MKEQILPAKARKTHTDLAVPKHSGKIQVVLNHPEPQKPIQDAPVKRNIPRHVSTEEETTQLFEDLHQLIGLENVKQLVYEIYALLQIRKFRQEEGLNVESHVYHMIFKGNPGTGKTTVARMIAKLFQAMGVLSKGHLIEVERADLVGEYIGHTALKTRELVKKAMGGILFIDEAYSLARGGEKDFGKEAIDALVKAMEDHKNQFILILAGYPDEIDDFLQTNPGLPSRFPIQVEFSDYSVEQLMQICSQMVELRDYRLHPNATQKLKQHMLKVKQEQQLSFSNARYIRNQIEKAIRFQAVRLLEQHVQSPQRADLMLLKAEDFRWD